MSRKRLFTLNVNSKTVLVAFAGLIHVFPGSNWVMLMLAGTDQEPAALFNRVQKDTIELAKKYYWHYRTLNAFEVVKMPCDYLTVAFASQHISYGPPLNMILLKLAAQKPHCEAYDEMWASAQELATARAVRCICLNDLVIPSTNGEHRLPLQRCDREAVRNVHR